MAISFNNITTSTGYGNIGNFFGTEYRHSINLPSTAGNGDVVLMVYMVDGIGNAPVAAVPSGWSNIINLGDNEWGNSTSDVHIQLFYKRFYGNEGSTVELDDYDGVGINRSFIAWTMILDGVDSQNPINTFSSEGITRSGLSVDAPSVTTTDSGTIMVFGAQTDDDGDPFSFSNNSFTFTSGGELQVTDGNGISGGWVYSTIGSSVTSGPTTVTSQTSTGKVAGHIVLKSDTQQTTPTPTLTNTPTNTPIVDEFLFTKKNGVSSSLINEFNNIDLSNVKKLGNIRRDRGFRYYRFYGRQGLQTPTTNKILINKIEMYLGTDGTGVKFPKTDLTGYDSDSMVTVSQGYSLNSDYEGWRAFNSVTDNSLDSWYTESLRDGNLNYLQVELTRPIEFESMKIYIDRQFTEATILEIYGSYNGEFNGEEILLGGLNDVNVGNDINIFSINLGIDEQTGGRTSSSNAAPLPSASPTQTPTNTPTQTQTPSNTATQTPTQTSTQTPTQTQTPSNTATQTPTQTSTQTPTQTQTPSNTATQTPTQTSTQTPTQTQTPSNTATQTPTQTSTQTPTQTQTPSNTATQTPTNTTTQTQTPSNTATQTPTNTPTQTQTPSNTATQTPTNTPSRTPGATPPETPTNTPTNTPTQTQTPSNTATQTPTNTPSRTPGATPPETPTNTPTNTPTQTQTPSNTATQTPTNTPTQTQTPSNTATQTPTNTPTQTQTPSNTATQTPTNTPTQTQTPSNTATQTPTNTPTQTQTPSNTATQTPSNTPTSSNTPTPSSQTSSSDINLSGLTTNIDIGDSLSYSGSGTIVYDLTNNNNNITLNNGPTYSSSNGGYIQFDGTNDYGDIGVNNFPTGNEITLGVWLRTNNLQTNTLFSFFNSSNHRITNIHVPWSNSFVYFQSGGDAKGWDTLGRTSTPSEYDEWTYWVFSKNASTGIAKIYRNGYEWASRTSLTRQLTAPTVATIGKFQDSNSFYTKSDFAMFHIYDRELSLNEIQTNYNNTCDRFGLDEITLDITSDLLYEYIPYTIQSSSPYDWTPTTRGSNTRGTIDNVAMSRTTYNGVRALYADGRNDYLRGFPIATVFENETEWSYSFWLNIGTGGNSGTYNAKILNVDMDDGGSGANYDFRVVRVNTPHQIQIAAKFDDSTQIYLTDSPGDVVGNSGWYNITHTHKAGESSIMYINGVTKSTSSVPSTAIFGNTSPNFSTTGARMFNVANSTWADGQGYVGYMGFWGKSLSSSEVQEVYNYGINYLGF